MKHRTVSGFIRYTSKKPEQLDKERGREWFTFTHHVDGSAIFRARCEIEEPAPTVLRDIMYSLDPQGRPQSLHVHLTIGDRFMGSGWLRHVPGDDGGLVECESFGPSIGRLSQQVRYSGAIDGFGTHPVAGDGYITRCMDLSKGPHRRTIRVFVPSPDHRGATPPQIAEVKIGLEYVGDETITVAAGKFACRHFRFVDDEGPGMGGKQHPHYDVWVTADDDAIFVQGGVGGYMQTWYELVELQR
ncbi:MAG TPA: hypothetical protein VIU34_32685 [Steroidobacter sp.]